MLQSLHLSNKMQMIIIPNLNFVLKICDSRTGLLSHVHIYGFLTEWSTQRSLTPILPYFLLISKILKGAFLGDLYLKQTWLQKQSSGIRFTPVYLNGILSPYILSATLYNAESQSILEFFKDNISICLSFVTKMDLFRVMFLTLLLCKMAGSCINPHKNTECYPLMLSHSIKEIVPECDGCRVFCFLFFAWLLKWIKC